MSALPAVGDRVEVSVYVEGETVWLPADVVASYERPEPQVHVRLVGAASNVTHVRYEGQWLEEVPA